MNIKVAHGLKIIKFISESTQTANKSILNEVNHLSAISDNKCNNAMIKQMNDVQNKLKYYQQNMIFMHEHQLCEKEVQKNYKCYDEYQSIVTNYKKNSWLKSNYSICQIFANKNVCSIILFGKTGTGKSTFANRLSLDFSLKGNEGPHKTSDSAESCTLNAKLNAITDHKNNIIVIVDTPGLSDSNGKDDVIVTELLQYFKDFGIGRKIICVPIIYGDIRLDRELQRFLELLYIFFGKEVWDQIFIIVTKMDTPLDDTSKIEFNKWKQTFIQVAKKEIDQCNLDEDKILTMGRHNYVQTVLTLYEYVVKSPEIQSELIDLIYKFNLSSSVKDMLEYRGSIIKFIKSKIEDEEKKMQDKEKQKALNAKSRREKLTKFANSCVIL